MKDFNDEKLFQFILKCQRNRNKPDLHSFIIDIDNGRAFVECYDYGVHIDEFIYRAAGKENRTQWQGTVTAATNRLEKLGAKYETIEV